MTNATTVGDRARERREELSLTLNQVAKSSGLSVGFLSDLERGRSKGTTKIVALASSLGVNAQWLETGRGARIGGTQILSGVQDRLTVYGFQLSEEACEFAQEWDKLPAQLRDVVRLLVELLVAKNIRETKAIPGARRKKERPHAST